MSCSAQKTPISLLQEICAQQGITPEYKLLSVEGAVHAPTFMYLVQVADVTARATGQSKKKAKHAAAKAILEKLLAGGGPFGDNGIVSEGVKVDVAMLNNMASEPCQLTSPQDDGIVGNPVGNLQEECMKERWQPPFYETVQEDGLPHERTFQMACYVNNFYEIGKGKSKRLAKRQAANKMLERLRKHKAERKEEEKKDAKVDGSPFSDVPDDVKDAKLSLLATVYSQHVLKFLKGLKSSNGPKLTSLQDATFLDIDSHCVDLLKEIAEEHNFEVSYFPIEEESSSGKYQCLVQLSSLPVAICFGSGATREEAEFDAAHNALQYLKIMSK